MRANLAVLFCAQARFQVATLRLFLRQLYAFTLMETVNPVLQSKKFETTKLNLLYRGVHPRFEIVRGLG